jgi:PAS domain S-box-containing protein
MTALVGDALPRTAAMWELFLANVPSAVAILDRDMRYVAVSERWYADLELTGRDLIGRSHYEVFPDLDDIRRERHRRCLAGETISHDGDDYLLPSGTLLSVRWRYVPWRDAEGAVMGIAIFSEVVTRERLLEERVEAESGRLKRAELVGRSGAWEWDLRTNVMTWSEGLNALLGLDGDLTDGGDPSWMGMVHPDDREATERDLERALKGETPYDIETRMVRRDGTVLNVRALAEVSRGPSGEPLSIIGVLHDVTDVRRQERELIAVHRRYRLASEVSGTAAWEIWPRERRLFADENLARLLGRGGERLTDDLDDWLAAFAPDDRRRVERMVGEVAAGNRSVFDLTFRTVLPDGRTVWLAFYGKVLGRRHGERLRIVGTTQEVTERKLAEMALEDSRRTLLVAQQLARLGSWEWDVGADAIKCSPEMLRIYGLPTTRTELPLAELMARVHPDDRERVAGLIERSRLGELESVETEMRVRRPDGETIWIRNMTRGLANDRGQVVRLNGAVQDITERKLADRQIALRDSALQASVGAVAMAGMDGYFVYGNRAFMELLGLESEAQLRALNALDAVRDPEMARAAFGSLVGEPGRWDGELPVKRMDGTPRDVLVTAVVHRSDAAEEPLIIASYMDVTERNEALRELARHERQLSRAQAMARMGTTYYDAATRLYHMPPETRAILGLGDEYAAFDAQTGRRLVHPDDWARIDDGAARLIKGAVDRDETTYRFLSPTLGMLHVQTVNDAERDGTGRLVGLHGVIQDVTHIKRAEAAAREARERAEQYLDIAGAIIIAFDRQARVTLINRQGRELLGYGNEEVLGRDWFDLAVPPDERTALRDAALRMMAEARAGYARREGQVLTRTGEARLIDWFTSLIVDGEGEVVGLLSSGRDLTDLRRAEQSLRDSEARTRAVMEAASVGIVTIDETGAVLSLNPQAERTFGRLTSEMAGGHISDLLPDDERPTWWASFQPAGAAGDPKAGLGVPREYTVRRPDGETVPVEMSVTPMPTAGGDAFVAAVQDITDRKRAEAQMQQVQRLETVGQLTGGVAHDFNNLLMAMQVNLEMLREMVEHDAEGREYADAALTSVGRGAELTRRLLAFSRRQPLQPKVTDINGLVRDTVRILQRTLGEQVTIDMALDPLLWPVDVDRAQLENVLVNLAVNARDAMPQGGRLTIETANRRLDGHYAAVEGEVVEGEYVLLAVSDTGTGMTPDVMARAFEPFFTTKDVGRGSGLGLSMTYGFVKQSGGHIKIYSEPGEGTTVKIYLPAARDAVPSPDPEPRAGRVKTGDELILLVEDDPAVRQTVTTLLQSLGYAVVVAEDGPEAIRLVGEGARPDLLLADIVLPRGMTGREVSDAIASRVPGCKTLFMSGYSENAVIHHGRLDEGVVLLSKPFPRSELAEKLRDVLDS